MFPRLRISCLYLLCGLFAVRVLAQPIAWMLSWEGFFAPARWSSGAIDYSLLLVLQIIVIILMSMGIRLVGQVRLSNFLVLVIKILAVVYAVTMFNRLAIGLFFPDAHAWFHYPLPTVFHLVIAAYLYCLAALFQRESKGEKQCTV